MEKSYRLILKNLPSVNSDKISELFIKFGKVENVDLKERKNAWEDDKINRFAFVTINATDRNLNTCFREINETLLEGNRLHVEVAKESFLDRLKKERNEALLKKEGKVPDKKGDNIKFIEFNNTEFKEREQTFTKNSVGFNETDENYFVNSKIVFDTEEKSPPRNCDIVSNFKNNYKKKRKLENGIRLPDAIKKKSYRSENEFHESMDKKANHKSFKKPEVTESERKRLASLKEKKQVYKAKEQAVRNALKIVDTANKSKKIIFNDVESNQNNEAPKKRKLCLDSDGDDEEFKFPDDNELNSKLKTKLSKLQSTVGNDERFILDDRFIEDEDREEEILKKVESDHSEERKRQLEILGGVLGKPISIENKNYNEVNKCYKSREIMVRYDPTEGKHEKYEIVAPKPEKVKRKRKKKIEEVKETEPVPVSNEVFYSVSDKLSNSLAEGEQFSLLKTLGKESTEKPNDRETEIPYNCLTKEKKYGFNLDSNKAFKYDSSEDDEPNADSTAVLRGNLSKSEEIDPTNSHGSCDNFFFVVDDLRFKECEEFFNNRPEQTVSDVNKLKTLRPILKQTIRKRIRSNLKKRSALYKKWERRN